MNALVLAALVVGGPVVTSLLSHYLRQWRKQRAELKDRDR